MFNDDDDIFDLDTGADFQKNDIVEFETAADHTGMPRWRNGLDYGSSGIFAIGRVTEITDEQITVSYTVPKHVGTGSYVFPNVSHKYYAFNQWSRPGFVRRTSESVCECGSWATYGRDTTCHTHYCPKHVDFKK